MKYFGVFDAQGFALAFYPEAQGMDVIPDGSVEMTEAQYVELLTYQGLRRWDGEKIVEYTPPEATPAELRAQMPPITKRQLRLILVRNGISLTDLDTAILAMGDEAIIEWQDASEYRRLHPLLNQVAAHLSLTQEQVDAMWQQALTA